jgi:hypothetical protein
MANKKKEPTEGKYDRIQIRCSVEDYERHGKGDPVKGKEELSKKFRELRDKQLK